MKLILSSILLSGSFVADNAFIILMITIPLMFLILEIFYLFTLQSTLKEVSTDNREIEPNQVWFILIPLFGFIFQFVVIGRIADSLKSEFAKRKISIVEERPGYTIGLIYCILICCGCIPVLGTIALIGGLVCWIIYWVQINGYKTKLKQSNSIIMNNNE